MSKSDLKTSGIILRTIDFKDSDKIFDLFTENGDVISFFARGAKNPKSKIFGFVSVGNFVSIAYSVGKNLNYPKEISYDLKKVFKFQAKSLQAMYFYSDILGLIRYISRDFQSEDLYDLLISTLSSAELKQVELINIYNDFLEKLIHILGENTEIACFISGETVEDKEFYYHPESNKVFTVDNRPSTLDLPLLKYDAIFCKNFLQKKLYEILNMRLRLKF